MTQQTIRMKLFPFHFHVDCMEWKTVMRGKQDEAAT
jgi:hypothetical protein